MILEALNQIKAARETIWSHVGQTPLPYYIEDLTQAPWSREDEEVWWWDEVEDLKAFLYNGGSFHEPEYAGEIYGTSFWEGPTYTLAVLTDETAYLFKNSNKVQ